MITQPRYKHELNQACIELGLDFSKLLVALRGSYREYLFVANDGVAVYKKGWMTGHLLDGTVKPMAFDQIKHADVSFNIFSGYFELSGPELPDVQSFSLDPDATVSHSTNALNISGKRDKALFEQAADLINQKIVDFAAEQKAARRNKQRKHGRKHHHQHH